MDSGECRADRLVKWDCLIDDDAEPGYRWDDGDWNYGRHDDDSDEDYGGSDGDSDLNYSWKEEGLSPPSERWVEGVPV